MAETRTDKGKRKKSGQDAVAASQPISLPRRQPLKAKKPAAGTTGTKKAKPQPVASPLKSIGEDESIESDEFDLAEDEDSFVQVESNPEQASDAESSASQRTPLPFNLTAQLLTDIQARGGIDRFGLESAQALSALCDSRTSLYGFRGDKLKEDRRKSGTLEGLAEGQVSRGTYQVWSDKSSNNRDASTT